MYDCTPVQKSYEINKMHRAWLGFSLGPGPARVEPGSGLALAWFGLKAKALELGTCWPAIGDYGLKFVYTMLSKTTALPKTALWNNLFMF